MAAITISDNDGVVSYAIGGTPSTGPFVVDFPYFFTTELVVTKIKAGVETTLVLTTDYSVSGTAADDGFSAGSVSLVSADSNCTITISRNLSTTKATNFPLNGPLSIASLNTLFSRLFSWVQDLRRKYGAAIHFPAGEESLTSQVAPAATRANKVLAYDANGNVTQSNLTLAVIEAPGTSAAAAAASASAASSSASAAAASAAAAATFDPANFYTKTASDARYYQQSNTYTKTEVDAAVAAAIAAASPFSTGDFITSLRSDARTGWVLINDGTLSKAGAGGTTLASATAENLYTFLWNNFNNTLCPVSTGRGVSAAADFAAGKTLTMTKMLGRALVVSGAGAGLTNRILGDVAGAETVVGQTKNHSHGGVVTGITVNSINNAVTNGAPSGDTVLVYGVSSTTGSSSAAGDGAAPADSVVQPQVHINVYIKL